MRFTKSWNTLYWFKQLAESLPDGEYIVQKYNPPRNLEQNKMYWALLTLVEKETWNDKEYLAEMMKMEFLWKKKYIKLWWKRKLVKKPWSTKNLKRDEMAYYYSQVERFFGDLWYKLPPPNTPEWQALVASCPEFYNS